MGSIPDGRYDATQDTIRIMATTAKSVQSLEQLAAVLRNVNRPGVSTQAVAAAIQSEAPQFNALVPVVQRGGFDVAKWLTLVLAAITVIIMMWDRLDPVEKGASPAQIREIYRQVIQQTQTAPSPTMSRVPPISPKPSPSRNGPCYCGSGKKYKRCHGRPSA
jgi:SEC-C motif